MRNSYLRIFFDRGGYVLDFTNRTFKEFFSDFNIDIEDKKSLQLLMGKIP